MSGNAEPITDASVLEKIDKGEELTPAEQEHLKGTPASEGRPQAVEKKEDDDPQKIVIKKEGSGTDAHPKSDEEKPADTSADAGKEKKQTPEELQKLIEAELAKPEAEQDLTKFSDSAIGTYWDLRRERKRRQKLEEENDVLKIEKIAAGLKKELKLDEKKEAVTEEDPLAFLDGKADDDILTVAEARKLAKAMKSKPVAPKEKEEPVKDDKPKMLRTPEQVRTEAAEADSRLKTKGIDDFYEVTDFAADILKGDDEAREILIETAKSGGNTAERTYWMIRGSKQWPAIKKAIEDQRAKLKKPDEKKAPTKDNTDRARRIEENDGKVRTTGPGSGAAAEVGEYTVEEIASMSIDDIKKLPKETRKLILKKFGSDPNLRG